MYLHVCTYVWNTHIVITSSLITGYVDALKQSNEECIDWLTAFKVKVTEYTAALLDFNFHIHTTQYYKSKPHRQWLT